jgi:hypothetical protein
MHKSKGIGMVMRKDKAKSKPEKISWSSVITNVLSVLAFLISGYALLQATPAREQQNEIQYLQWLEQKMYETELEHPKLLCLYPGRHLEPLGCTDGDKKLTPENVAYASLAADLAKSIHAYNEKWCTQRIMLLQMADCDFDPRYLADFETDPTGVFSLFREPQSP